MSGVTYAHSWAIMGLGNMEVKDPNANAGATKLTRKYEKDVNMVARRFLGATTPSTFARPLWNESRYFGWNRRVSSGLIEEVCDKLKAPDSLRFWR